MYMAKILYKWNDLVCAPFFFFILSLSIVTLELIHVTASIRNSFIHLAVLGHLGCFQVLSNCI